MNDVKEKKDKKSRDTKIGIIISFLMAIILWIYVIGVEDPNTNQRFNNITVSMDNALSLESKGLVLAEDQEFAVDISVYGRTSAIYDIRNKIRASVDLAGINEKGTYLLDVELMGIPSSVELNSVTPNQISIIVDRIVTEERDVNIELSGVPKGNLTILDYEVSSKKVNITGAEEILKKVSKITTAVSVEGASSDVKKTVQLLAVDKDGNSIEGIKIDSQTVEVTVHIGTTKKIDITADISGEPARGHVISQIIIEPTQISLGAKGNLLNDIATIKTESIRVNGATSTIEKEVQLVLPSGIASMNGSSKVKVKVVIEKIQSKEFTISKIELRNQADNVNIALPEGYSIQLVLEGKQGDLDKVLAENIKLYIDVKDASIGESNVDINLEDIPGVTLKSITPKSIKTTVTQKVP